MFIAILCANLVTVLICLLAYSNMLLMGDYAFVFFIAFMTSIPLRAWKSHIVKGI